MIFKKKRLSFLEAFSFYYTGCVNFATKATFYTFIHHSIDFLPSINDSRKRTIKMKNNTFAMPAALAATPVNPNIPATMATIRKITVQRNIVYIF